MRSCWLSFVSLCIVSMIIVEVVIAAPPVVVSVDSQITSITLVTSVVTILVIRIEFDQSIYAKGKLLNSTMVAWPGQPQNPSLSLPSAMAGSVNLTCGDVKLTSDSRDRVLWTTYHTESVSTTFFLSLFSLP